MKTKILDINVENEKISLGIKQLKEDKFTSELENIKLGDTVTCLINKISDNNTKIRSKSGEEHNISDCYLRKCSKNIYLHVDANPSDTLILGKTDSSTSLSNMDF